MGKGIDAAKLLAPEHAAVMEEMRDQLLIVFLKRLGGSVTIPVAEVDNTGGDTLALSLRDGKFHFEIQRKA